MRNLPPTISLPETWRSPLFDQGRLVFGRARNGYSSNGIAKYQVFEERGNTTAATTDLLAADALS
jgi:hypothetical protein